MSESFERRTISLVIRLWVEPLQDQDGARWRGQIEDVASGETTHFQVPSGLIEYLAAHLPGAPSGLRRDAAAAQSDLEGM